jgi:hypothetical protein
MEISYIIMAHDQPELFKRLVQSLKSFNTRFYVHIDKNQDIKPFAEEFGSDEQVYFLNDKQRQPVTWADSGMLKGTLEALKQIADEGRKGYCILLSGRDYPVKSNDEIYSFLQKSAGINFISYELLPWRGHEGMERITKYKIDVSRRRGDFVYLPSLWEKEFYQLNTAKKIYRLFRRKKFTFLFYLLRKRKFPSYLKPFAGASWWALPVETVKKILTFVHEHPDFIKFHEFTFVPDEAFFQPIILHLHESNQIGPIAPMLTFVDWSRPAAGLPAVLRMEDTNLLKNLPKEIIIARKFDLQKDANVIDWIEQELLKKIPFKKSGKASPFPSAREN